jgi:hypothetical protein
MLSDTPFPSPSGSLSPELHLPSTAKHRLFDFIADEMPAWRDDHERPTATSETVLTSSLCAHLNTAARHSAAWNRIQFLPEEPDEAKPGRKIDLSPKPCGASIWIEGRRHTQFDKLFPVECKRLPMPEPNNKKRDEREYVFNKNGSTGGIQRFKEGNHGGEHKFGGMIAFIQDDSGASKWHSTVNKWILEIADQKDSQWSKEDQLSLHSENPDKRIHKYHSAHERPAIGSAIALRHAWIELN